MNAGADMSTGKQNTDIDPMSYSNNYYGYTGWSKMDTYNLSFNAYAQYLKDFAKIHHIDVMAGYEYQHFHKKQTEMAMVSIHLQALRQVRNTMSQHLVHFTRQRTIWFHSSYV